ncbi:MAG: hypothetical protein NXI16_06905 [Alphaproteobacteria bacterium]|nr:hypothetical protein [Alphaproteobacteria bacterium]
MRIDLEGLGGIAKALVVLLAATAGASDRAIAKSFPSPEAFARHLQAVVAKGDRDLFAALHLMHDTSQAELPFDPDYLSYVFDRDSSGAALPDLMARPDLIVDIHATAVTRLLEGQECPLLERYVVLYTLDPPREVLRRYETEPHERLVRDWKTRFVETVFHRCGDRYGIAFTAFYAFTSYPWAGEYG